MNKLDAQIFIIDISTKYWSLLQRKYGIHIGAAPKISYVSKATKNLGFAYYRGDIEFNLAYFCTHKNMQDLEEIVAHELCHIVQYKIYPEAKQSHGPEFRNIMNSIGFAGDTYAIRFSIKAAKANAVKIRNEITLIDL